jgi:hypothetical protein
LNTIWKSTSIRRQIEAGSRTTNGTFKINQGVVEGISIMLPHFAKQRVFADIEARVSGSAGQQQDALGECDTLFRLPRLARLRRWALLMSGVCGQRIVVEPQPSELTARLDGRMSRACP